MAGNDQRPGETPVSAGGAVPGDALAPFASVEEYGRLAMAWVSALLKRQIQRARRQGLLPAPIQVANDPLAGAYISDNEIENASFSLLQEGTTADDEPRDEAGSTQHNVAALGRALQLRLHETRRRGVFLPILRLQDELRLTDEELQLLLVVAAIAGDARLRRMVAYLQNDLSRRRPDAGTALSLLADRSSSAELPWHLLAPKGTLRWFNLIGVQSVERERATWLMDRPLAVPDAVAAYVCRGQCWLDESVAELAQVLSPRLSWAELNWTDSMLTPVRRAFEVTAAQVNETGRAAGLILRGPIGSGKKTAALAFCHEHGRRLLVVDSKRLPAGEDLILPVLRTLARDARIHGAYLYFEHCEALKQDNQSNAQRLQGLVAAFQHNAELMLFSTELEERVELEQQLFLAEVLVPKLPTDSRALMWRERLPATMDPAGNKARYLAEQFPVAPGVITQVGDDIRTLLRVAGSALSQKELGRMVLQRSRHNLQASATEVVVWQTWDDIILPRDILERCIRIVQFVKYHSQLSERWGYGKKLLTNPGISALFSGPPGVGKTMMAGLLGRELGLDVFRIDVSRILSKWVGETEKNLSNLFAEANRTRAVLVFDEADALFSKRTDVKSAADRYSNVEVNYLLQKMERFEGIIILTTNLEKGVDEAFVRRIDFKVRFPEPTVEERRMMWERMLPREVSFAPDVDLEELAHHFELTGGYIKKAIIRAGLIAMERHGDTRYLHRADLWRAVNEELQEAGKLAYDLEE